MKEKGIDLDARDKWGRIANDVYLDHTAGQVGLTSLAMPPPPAVVSKIMRSLSKLIEAPLNWELFQSHLKDVESVNPWGKDMFGLTALMKVAAWNHERALVLLLAHSSANATHINLRDADGNTALHHAAMMNATRTFDILSQHPLCDVNVVNKAGKKAVLE